MKLHVETDQPGLDNQLSSRLAELARKTRTGQYLTDEELAEIHELNTELKSKNMAVVHVQSGSVFVWILCKTPVSLTDLKTMLATGFLQNILVRLFNSFKVFTEILKLRLTVSPEEITRAQKCYSSQGLHNIAYIANLVLNILKPFTLI